MRSLPNVLVLLSVGAASTAFADPTGQLIGALGFSLSEISCRASTAVSNASSSSSTGKSECDGHGDCHQNYECQSGRCARRVATVTTYSTPAPIEPEAQPVPALVPQEKCSSQTQCGQGRSCASGLCVASPPMPSSSLRREVSELYLRERVVALREELALGKGPVINGLAKVEGVPVKQLGRVLREHRTELVALIGDASGAEWSARFLARVEELCHPS